MVKETLPITKWATATTTTLVPVTRAPFRFLASPLAHTSLPLPETVTSITTKFSTAQYAAAGRYPAAAATGTLVSATPLELELTSRLPPFAESVSTETVVRAVSTLVIPTTIVWRQNVIQKVTSTIVWHVFDITTGAFPPSLSSGARTDSLGLAQCTSLEPHPPAPLPPNRSSRPHLWRSVQEDRLAAEEGGSRSSSTRNLRA